MNNSSTDQDSTERARKLPGQARETVGNPTIHRIMDKGAQDARRNSINFGDRLRDLRLNLNMRQQDMAKALGCALRSLQMYETGERFPPVNVLIEIYALFDIDIEELFFK